MREDVDHIREKIDCLEKEEYPERQGPVCSGLDLTLQKHIRYLWGHIMVDHWLVTTVITYVTPHVYKDIIKQLVCRAIKSTNNSETIVKASIEQQRFGH